MKLERSQMLGLTLAALTGLTLSGGALANPITWHVESAGEAQGVLPVKNGDDNVWVWESTIETAIVAGLNEHWSIATEIVLEPVVDGDGTSFSQEGAYIGVLELAYSRANWTIAAGKIGPNFATAWDITPGVFGMELAEEYEVAEQIGVRTDFLLPSFEAQPWDEAVVSSALFMTDTSVLSQSILRDRGRVRESDGGPGNTGSLKSYAFALDMYDMLAEGIHFHVSHRRLAQAHDMAHPDDATAAAINWHHEGEWAFTPSINLEHIWYDNPQGAAGDGDSTTMGVVVERGRWRAGAVYSRTAYRWHTHSDYQRLREIAVGYSFTPSLTVDLAYKQQAIKGEDKQDFLGILIAADLVHIWRGGEGN